MQQTWLGIDAGTQSVKAALVTDDGAVIASASVPLQSRRSGLTHRQDPRWWYLAAEEAIRGALAELDATRYFVSGLSITATSGTITTVDAAGEPVSDGIMYDDASADGTLVRSVGEHLWNELGYAMSDSWALPKIVALSSRMTPGDAIAHQADVIAARLVGHRVASDWSHALKSGFDTHAVTWPRAVMDTLRIDAGILPHVVAPGQLLGTVHADAAERTGLPAGVPVIAGMTDGCASQIASGALELGSSASSIGTTLVVKTISPVPLGDRVTGVYSHRSPTPDQWFVGGASNVGAGILSQLFTADEIAALTPQLGTRHGLPLVYPLTADGERFPFSSAQARGFTLEAGLRRPLTRGTADPLTLFAAVMQGIAIVERLSFDTLRDAGAVGSGAVALLGGATDNPWWNQLRADMLEQPVRIPATPSASIGAAVLAASGVTGRSLAEHASEMVQYRAELQPVTSAELQDARAAILAELTDAGWLQARTAGVS